MQPPRATRVIRSGTAPAPLHLAHWQEPPAGLAPPRHGGLVIRTCLRQLLVDSAPLPWLPGRPEYLAGEAAYRLLLEVLTGLRSRVPGETNVAGQVRQAWHGYRTGAPAGRSAALTPWLERAQRDAAAIRGAHLQGLGGNSYGALVRKLLAPRRGDRLLLVGCGDLARSLLPYFGELQLGLWHYRELAAAPTGITQLFAPGRGAEAAAWARHVVLTTPPDPHTDGRWRDWLGEASTQQVLHLGRRRDAGCLVPDRRCLDLDHVFELRASLQQSRSLQLHRARLACAARAAALPADWRAAAAPARALA